MSELFTILIESWRLTLLCALLLVVAFFVVRFVIDFKRSLNMVFLKILIPKKDAKEDKETDHEQFGSGKDFQKVIGVMGHLLQNLQVTFSKGISAFLLGQDFFSLEIAVIEGQIYFYVVCPRRFERTIEKQIASFYDGVAIEKTDDYNFFKKGQAIHAESMHGKHHWASPLRGFTLLPSETLNPLLGSLAKIQKDEGAAVQIMLRPQPSGWQKKVRLEADTLLNKKARTGAWWNPFSWIKILLHLIVFGPKEDGAGPQGSATQDAQDAAKLAAEKAAKPGFDAIIRIVGAAPTNAEAKDICQSMRASFEQFASGENSLEYTRHHSSKAMVRDFIFRSFRRSFLEKLHLWHHGTTRYILGVDEIASIFHFPNARYNTSPAIVWQEYRIEPAPPNLPPEGTLLGRNRYRGQVTDVRITRNDRRRHFYLIGKSGTGKSTLLEQMIRQDIQNGEGCCVIDPHGDLCEAMVNYLPKSRADDLIYFDPGDLERPIGLNMLEGATPDEREFMSQEALAIFIKMFGEEIMGPRLQDYFRNGTLTLMEDQEEGATLIDIVKLFSDDEYQARKVAKVTNPVVRSFWDKQMAMTGQREKQEIIPYFAAKFGPFVTNTQIRNIIGQTKSGFNVRKVMDEGKILLCNLSKGKLGDLNAQLLGSILVAKIQMAAMSRVDTPEKDRRDFYLYVDEFQNFVTDSFASILSEARKYRLNLIVAHQYISQITKMKQNVKGNVDDPTIRDAVFGNVGSMMCFKIGAQDAETMAKEFQPVFTEQDLINIANYRACIRLNVDGTTSRGFTMETIYDETGKDEKVGSAMKQLSRLKYGRDREFVETEIFKRIT